MKTDITVTAEPRAIPRQRMRRAVRARGLIPGRFMAPYKDPCRCGQPAADFTRSCIARPAQHHLQLDIQGGENTPSWWSTGNRPIRGICCTSDLKRMISTKRIRVSVPVLTHGEPQGEGAGGLLEVHHARNRD